MLPQDVPRRPDRNVYDVVASGGLDTYDLLRDYHNLTLQIARNRDIPCSESSKGTTSDRCVRGLDITAVEGT